MRRQAMGGTRYCVGVSRRRRNDSRGQVAAQEAHLSGVIESLLDGDGGENRARTYLARDFPWLFEGEWELERWAFGAPGPCRPRVGPIRSAAPRSRSRRSHGYCFQG